MYPASAATEPLLCRVLIGVYGAALRVLPGALRGYRAEIQELFRHQVVRLYRAGGRLAALAFALGALADIPAAKRAARKPEPAPSNGASTTPASRPPTLPKRGETMERYIRTFRLAGRMLRKRPGYAAAVALTLGLGIAATTTVFSLVNAVNFGAFPYPDAERLVLVNETLAERGDAPAAVSYLNFESWRAAGTSFSTIAAQRFLGMPLVGEEDSRLAFVNLVSDGYLDLLGASTIHGRLLSTADIEEGRDVAIISAQLWSEDFGSDPQVVGKALRLGSRVRTVIGVMSPDFHDLASPTATDAWLPAPAITEVLPVALENRRQRAFQVVARLADGSSLESATGEMKALAASLLAEFPQANQGFGVALQSLREGLGGTLPDRLLMLLAGATGLLVVACINVAGIVLVRGAERGGEIAVHRALGASRFESAAGLVAESVILALVAAAGGVALAALALRMVLATGVMALPAYVTPDIDVRVLSFAVVSALLVGVLAGIVPAVRVSGADLRSSLGSGGGRTVVSRRSTRSRSVLVIAELAAAVVLVVGAGLLIRSVQSLRGTDVGFRASHVVVGQIALPRDDYDLGAVARVAADLRDQLEAIPGVEFATIWGPNYPFSPTVFETVLREGESDADNRPRVIARYHTVSPGALRAMEVPLVAGRSFEDADREGGLPVVVISEALAEELWPGEDPVGRRIGTGSADGSQRIWHTVVGVARTARWGGRQLVAGGINTDNEIYYPVAQRDHRRRGELVLLVGHAAGIDDVAERMRDAVAAAAPEIPLQNVQGIADVIGAEVQLPDFTASLMTVFGGLALFMAALGIYSVLAQTATQRRGEIGLRKALGATDRDIVGLMLGSGLKMAVVGILVGILLTLWTDSLLVDFLYDIEPDEPTVLLAACALLLTVAAIAALLPTLRTLRISASSVLRDSR